MKKSILILLIFCFCFSLHSQRRRKVKKEDLLKEFDLTNFKFKKEELFAPGLPKDAIPAITNPQKVSVANADFAKDNWRVAAVTVNGETAGYPLEILLWHEIINDNLGKVPVAVTYCPLCDSVAVFKRSFKAKDGKEMIGEFGVSGLLLNSNVVMYNRRTNALWSQAFMQALSGPNSGKSLEHYKVKMMTFKDFKKKFPKAQFLSNKTGHRRPYGYNPYKKYWDSDKDLYKTIQFKFGDKLPAKALGVGIKTEDKIVFVTRAKALEGKVTVKTKEGDVIISAGEAGMNVEKSPKNVMTMQVFYHTWSGFFPQTEIICTEKEKKFKKK